MITGEIARLGYLGVVTSSMDDWREFATHLLGMQVQPISTRTMGLRMDSAHHRLALRESDWDGVDYYGWEVKDGRALQTLAARIDRAGFQVTAMHSALRDERRVSDGFHTVDPVGNRLEFFHGQGLAEEPFNPGRQIEGFRTGTLGMGHAVLNVTSIEAVLPYYADVLGFRLSDYTLKPFKAYFFHTNTRHHSLALIENDRAGLHHLMVELDGLDDVGQAYDLAQLEPGRVATTLGRHSNDHMTSFYVRSPSGFLVEYGWGGRDIDPQSWQPFEMHHGPSLWGHDRDWLPDSLKDAARQMRLAAAAEGIRAPLRVCGNASSVTSG